MFVERPANTTRVWRFGVFEVDAADGELRRGGRPVKMREQSFRILVFLLEHSGEVVTREELRAVLWPSDTFVDFDHSLNTAVMKLRDALGDSAETPLYIETLPKRGYRFIAPMAIVEPEARTISSVIPAETSSGASRVPPHRFLWTVAAIAFLLFAAAGSIWFLRARHFRASTADERQLASAFQIVPITTAPGDAITPAFSPDGREIAFAWDGPERKRYDIYVQLVGADMPLQLTHSKRGLVGAPAWSPDGNEIAFSRCDGKNDGVFVVPALGGAERQVTTVGCLYTLPGPLAWIDGGKEMLMIDHCSGTGPFGVVLFSLTTGDKHCLTNSGSPKGSDAGYGFSLSPDGRTIAFARSSVSLCCNVYTVPITGGAPRLLADDRRMGCSTLNEFGCARLMWTPDSRSIVFVSNRTTLPSLWRVPAIGGPVVRETIYPGIGSFSKDGQRFVYSEKTSAETPSIWRADFAAGGFAAGHRKLIQTQYPEMDAQPSPDGTRIVWMSIRTGSEEIWTSSANGEGARQLTHLDRYSGTPRWSPDGRWIAFDSYTPDGARIFVVDLEGRNLHPITNGPGDDAVPSWSRDGESIYFASKRTGDWQVWKHSLVDGKELQLTQRGGFDPFESSDGQTVYFSRFDQAGIWSLPAKGGAESLVVADKPQLGYWGHWAVTSAGLYVLDTDAEPRATIEFYDFARRRTSAVLTLDMRPARQQPSLSATMDGKTVFYTQYDPQSVIKMMEFSQ
jgi:Tol biopolymer transport system component/DNA-binding winged helix-turn-helix (wHTH) protein